MTVNGLIPKVWLQLLQVSALILLLQACDVAQSEPVAEVIKPVKILEVPDTYKRQDFSFVAQVSATQRAKLAFQVPGKLQSFDVRMGQKVKKGDLLAQLDPSDYQLRVKAKRAQYELQKLKLNRATQLFKKQLISEDKYDQLKTSFAAIQSELEQAKTDLQNSKLRAPFSGVISYTQAKNYQIVGAKQTILHLQGRDQLDIKFSLPITSTEQINFQKTLPAELWVTLDSFPGLKLPALFKEIATQPDADTNSYAVTLMIQRPAQFNILPGMSGKVQLKYEAALLNHFTLPQGAIIDVDTQPVQVWRINSESQRLEAVTVELDEQGAVIGGLNAGDKIVAAGAKELSDGQRVGSWKREGGI